MHPSIPKQEKKEEKNRKRWLSLSCALNSQQMLCHVEMFATFYLFGHNILDTVKSTFEKYSVNFMEKNSTRKEM